MMTLQEATVLLRGENVHPQLFDHEEIRFLGVAIDSRKVRPGDLFVALPGERADGHDFLDKARASGAVAALVSRRREGHEALPQLLVDDCRKALGALARGWRRRFRIPVITVAGSNGKTTTKEMIASILGQAFGEENFLATAGNLNNDLGLPLTLLRLRSHHRAAVVEIGMNHPGETALLANIALPSVALVCNAQREHLEFMDNVGAVAYEHALAILALPPHGTAVFPADDERALTWSEAAGDRRIVDFSVRSSAGTGAAATIASVMAHPYLEVDGSVVHLATPAGTTTLKLHAPGLHNVRNAAAAGAAAVAIDIPIDAIHRGLEAFSPVKGRMQRRILQPSPDREILLIDDSYNANPDSMRAAIDVLAQCPAPTLLVVGDMGEVGVEGPRYHAEIGGYAHERGIDALFATGPLMLQAVHAFGPRARHFTAIDALIAACIETTTSVEIAGAGDEGDAVDALELPAHRSVLVKGSRFMRMERVCEALADAHMAANTAVHDSEHAQEV